MNRKDAVSFLLDRPVDFAKAIGFNKLTEIHNQWIQDMVVGKDDRTLQAHRGSYKTTCVTVAMPIIMLLFPNDRILFERKTEDDVKEVISQVCKVIQSDVFNVFAETIYGRQIQFITQKTEEITIDTVGDLRGTSQLVGMGIGGSLTGKHFDRIFTDDIVNLNDRVSKAERDRTRLVYQELQNVKNRGGRIFNTGTPWHPDDCFRLMPNPVKYPWDATGLISAEEAKEIKEHMTNSLFAANYELKHIADDDVIFADPQVGADPALAMQSVAQLDAAFYGEDYTALTIMGIHGGKFYVFGKCWRKHVDDVMDEIVMWYEKFMAGKMYVELNADKGYVAKQLKKKGVRVATYNENQNKHIKIVSYLKFEWKNVIFVEGTDEQYIDQICDYNENAEHDDCPDSLASLIRAEGRKLNRPEAEEERKSIFY